MHELHCLPSVSVPSTGGMSSLFHSIASDFNDC